MACAAALFVVTSSAGAGRRLSGARSNARRPGTWVWIFPLISSTTPSCTASTFARCVVSRPLSGLVVITVTSWPTDFSNTVWGDSTLKARV